MEYWELVARESIRDLVARYNANGDSGRFEQLRALFAPDAVMDTPISGVRTGHEEIIGIFADARDNANKGNPPMYLRHMTSTHQIDIIDESAAKGRCYYFVLTAVGLDHWGRYIDHYRTVDGVWKFARRWVTVDGSSPTAMFVKAQ
jgi:hypothetical protein